MSILECQEHQQIFCQNNCLPTFQYVSIPRETTFFYVKTSTCHVLSAKINNMCHPSTPRESTGFFLNQPHVNPRMPRASTFFLSKQLLANLSIPRETTCFYVKTSACQAFSAKINNMCYPSTSRESTGFLLNKPHVNPRMPRASTDFFSQNNYLPTFQYVSLPRETTCFYVKTSTCQAFSAKINNTCYPSTSQPHVNPRMPRASTFFWSKQLLANLSTPRETTCFHVKTSTCQAFSAKINNMC